MRIVSLIASATEIVCALGREDQLVGISHECDFPPSVTRLPRLTSPKFPTDGTSYQIDERVRAILAEGLSVYRVDAAAVRALKPDVIVTQTQCEVCAVSERDVEDALADWTGARPKVVSLRPDRLDDVWDDIRRVAAAIGGAPDEVIGRLRARLDALASRTRAVTRPRVAVVEWIDPLMSGGNWMPELIDLAGGQSLFGEVGKHSPMLAWDDLVAAKPDIVFVVPCGFDLARTLAEMHTRDWSVFPRVVVADGNAFFNRPGPRLVESAEILAEVCHPGVFDFGHEGRGWLEVSTR
jgi:iron complex transport system substrate-binding protein